MRAHIHRVYSVHCAAQVERQCALAVAEEVGVCQEERETETDRE